MGGVKAAERQRDFAETVQRNVYCKECRREEGDVESAYFSYDEQSAAQTIERGGLRSDRCPKHRRHHRTATSGLAVAYIDLETLGEVRNRDDPTGPLGGLGALPDAHERRTKTVDLQDQQFGMGDEDVKDILAALVEKRVLVLEAGTGTGKSTFAPFRMMEPPDGAAIRLCDRGPIIVTEPRRQAATGVARFVAEMLCGTPCGPGFRVGYQIAGDRQHDQSCQLIYVTDGTFINWLADGTLGRISIVIIDEAHERSENIDFILGMLRYELPKYPHLRVVITSATINSREFIEYFGGDNNVAHLKVEEVKSFGYGRPFFARTEIPDIDKWTKEHWPEQFGPRDDNDRREDLWATTRALYGLRYDTTVADEWKTAMPPAVAEQVLKLHWNAPPGDILAFLPTRATIEAAVGKIKKELDDDEAEVYELLASTPTPIKDLALAPGTDRRKIVVSSNLAETSLTVKGVRYIVDSGLIAQSEWDPDVAEESVPTRRHSRAGLKQRWGRAGRSAPGWVFTLYSEEELDGPEFADNTAPGAARANSESLLLKAKARGVDEPRDLVWLTNFEHSGIKRDEEGKRASENLTREMDRGSNALGDSGAVDEDGHLTLLGREVERFSGRGSAARALAVMLADQLTCVPEVVMGLAALEGKDARSLVQPSGLLDYDHSWPTAWRVEAAQRHHALAADCRDDLHLVLRTLSLVERDEINAAQWWLNGETVERIFRETQDTLDALSPMMKKEAARPLDMRLLDRARAVITRAFSPSRYERTDSDTFRSVGQPDSEIVGVIDSNELIEPLDSFVVLKIHRPAGSDRAYLSNLVSAVEWATDSSLTSLDLVDVAAERRQESEEFGRYEHAVIDLMARLPIGSRLQVPKEVKNSLRLVAPPWTKPVDDLVDEDLPDADTNYDPNASETPEPTAEEEGSVVQDPRDAETNDEPAEPNKGDQTVERHEFAVVALGEADEVEIQGLNKARGERIRISGYALDAQPKALFEKDWRQADDQGDPGQHDDLKWGDTVELTVGESIHDHRAHLRALLRTDGRGRFLLGPHNRKSRDYQRGRVPPVALDLRDFSLPQRLVPGKTITGVVIPGPNRIPEVSLLGFLLRELEKSNPRMLRRKSGGGNRVPFWSAVARSHSNEAGYAQFEIPGPQFAQRFSVRAESVEPGTELLLSLALAMPEEIALSVPSDEVMRFADDHRSFMHAREREGEVKLQSTWKQLPLPEVRKLAELVKEEAWERRVYAWWAATACRRAGEMLDPEEVGEVALQEKSHSASNEVVEETLLPVHVVGPMRDRLASEIAAENDGVAITVLPAGKAVISGGSDERVRAAAKAVAALAAAPAVLVEVAEGDVGRLIGRGGRNLNELAARPGIVWCTFERSSGALLIIAEKAETLLDPIAGISKRFEGATALLEVPPKSHGRLFGSQHATQKRLLSESGCTDAKPVQGSDQWELRAPSTDELEAFQGLASRIVGPCQLTSVSEHPVRVVDAHTQKTIENWRERLTKWAWPAAA